MAAGIGSVISTPNIAGNRQFRTYLNQSMATSGRTPSATTLDQIIQAELDAQGRRMTEQRRLGLEERRLTEGSRQFDIGQQNAKDIAERGQNAGLVEAGAGLGTTLMGLNYLSGKPLAGETLSGLWDAGSGYLGGGGGAVAAEGIGKVGTEAGKGLFTGGGAPEISQGFTTGAADTVGGGSNVAEGIGSVGTLGSLGNTASGYLGGAGATGAGGSGAGLTAAQVDAAIAADMSMEGVGVAGAGSGSGAGAGGIGLGGAAGYAAMALIALDVLKGGQNTYNVMNTAIMEPVGKLLGHGREAKTWTQKLREEPMSEAEYGGEISALQGRKAQLQSQRAKASRDEKGEILAEIQGTDRDITGMSRAYSDVFGKKYLQGIV